MDKIYQLFDGQWIDLSHVLVVGNAYEEHNSFRCEFEIKFMFNQSTIVCWFPDQTEVYDSVRGKDTSGWNEDTACNIWREFYNRKMIEFQLKRDAFIEDLKRFKR